MALILSSIFRNSERYIPRYVEQVRDLAEHVDLRVVVAEGDSTDNTAEMLPLALDAAGLKWTVLTVNHGGPEFGSVNNPVRWAQIAKVCNAVLDEVRYVISEGESWLYVESDLVWPRETMLGLLSDLDAVPAIAPMSMNGKNGNFFDVWGHRINGEKFGFTPPYHPNLNGSRYVKIDSCGSCFAMLGECVNTTSFGEEDCIRGVGRTLYENGYSLWLDTHLEVLHP